MNKEQIKGHYEEAKGKAKEVAGHVVGNEELELEGKLQKNAGKIQAGVGDVAAEIEDVAAAIKKRCGLAIMSPWFGGSPCPSLFARLQSTSLRTLCGSRTLNSRKTAKTRFAEEHKGV